MTNGGSLKKHIKNKKSVLSDLCIQQKEIDAIPWDKFSTIAQVDNYCRKVINDFFDK